MARRRHRYLLLIESAELGSVLGFTLGDCEAAIFNDPDRANDAFCQESFDLAIVDLSPKNRIVALDMIRAWRAAGSSTPIIATSDIPHRGLVVESLEAGADDFLRKPFHHAELRARIQKLVARRSAHTSRRAGGVILCPASFHFGGAEVTPNLVLKFEDGAEEKIRPKHLGILKTFAASAGGLVLKEDLIKAVWGSDADRRGNSVNQYISILRQLFHRHGIDLNHWIASEPKAGWRIHAAAASPVSSRAA